MFGSAGVLTRPAGCSRHGGVLGHHQLSEGSSTHSRMRIAQAMHAVMDRDAAELGIIPNKDGLWIDWSDTEDVEASEVKTTR